MSKKRSKLLKKRNTWFNNKKIIAIIVVIVALVGVLALRLSSAATYDGWQRIRILNTAVSQIGNKEWEPQVMKYSEQHNENWCADFVSWVYWQSGYQFIVPTSPGRSNWRIPLVYKQVSGVPNLRDYLKIYGAYKTKESGYLPAPGDIVIFARQGRSHTGIIERAERPASKNENWIYTIEGNTSTQNVDRRSYPLSDATIDGYGTILSRTN
ncbi:MAG: CHAP domain-containing protein [Candidatus Saccharibacteria bacterium]